jgi:hypothetical protein
MGKLIPCVSATQPEKLPLSETGEIAKAIATTNKKIAVPHLT